MNDETHPQVAQYLKALSKRLRWVPKERQELLSQEVRGHLEEIATDIGGDAQTRYTLAIDRFGAPEIVAGQFIEAYGYGRKYLIVMALAGFFLALLTIPIQIPFQPQLNGLCTGLPLLITILVFYMIIRVSINAGKWTGLAVGISCGLSRLLALGTFMALVASNPDVEDKLAVPSGVVAGIFLVSLLMVVSGYLPGRTLQLFDEDSD